MTTILVTGATGTVGANVVAALAKQSDVKVRAAVRDRSKAARLPAGVEAVDFAWDDHALVAAAVQGADAVFLLTPFVDSAVAYTKTLVAAAQAAGVKKIVKLSAAGAEHEAFQLARWHRAAERLVEGAGPAWVVLRPNFYMSNFVHFYPPDSEGAIYLPTGSGKAAWIDPRDIAEVAAAVLTRPDWDGQALALTGPQALSVGDVAHQISQVARRPVSHVDVTPAAARAALTGMNLPGWMIDGMMDLNTVIANSWAAGTTDLVERITGHPPRPFAGFAHDHAAAFAKTQR